MTVAFYQTLQDKYTKLSVNNTTHSISWNPANDIVLDRSSVRPVLCYRVTPSYSARVRLIVQINGNDIGKRREAIRGPGIQTFQEIVNRSAQAGLGDNNITFEIRPFEDGDLIEGYINLSDIIVWYARAE